MTTPDIATSTCNCRWEGDKQVQQCKLHQAHVDAIHEWAERAKASEARLIDPAEYDNAGEAVKRNALWQVCKVDECRVITADREEVATVAGDYEFDYARMAARARLISAAPELLEALQAVVAGLDTLENRAKIRAAIAKATGA